MNRPGEPPATAPHPTDADLDAWIERLRGGDRRALSRSISLIENGDPAGRALVARIHPRVGTIRVVGVTGVPGAGKSTLVAALARQMGGVGRRVAVLAVDPSSPVTGGALLGDRVRNADDAGAAFFRSLASRGGPGGLSHAVADVVDLLDFAGFDTVLVETVGTGQSDVTIATLAQTTLLVTAPGLGDMVQAMKAGILELASIVAVNKADLPGAAETAATLRRAGRPAAASPDWPRPVVTVSALAGTGLDALAAAIEEHGRHLRASGALARHDAQRQRARFEAELGTLLLAAAREALERSGRWDALLDDLAQRRTDPRSAAVRACDGILGGTSPARSPADRISP